MRRLWYAWIVLLLAVWLWLAMTLLSASESFSAIAALDRHDTYDVRGIQFYELKLKGGNATIAADADTELARYLRSAGPKVRVTLEPYQVETITR